MSDLFAVAFPIAVVSAGCWAMYRIKHSPHTADRRGHTWRGDDGD